MDKKYKWIIDEDLMDSHPEYTDLNWVALWDEGTKTTVIVRMNEYTNREKIKRGDFVSCDGTNYLVTQQDSNLFLWDFHAWLDGFYDAYVPVSECNGILSVIGNLKDNPDLLPKECGGYDGEPNIKVIERIWTNKSLSGCEDNSHPCCERRNIILSKLTMCPQRCSCHEGIKEAKNG